MKNWIKDKIKIIVDLIIDYMFLLTHFHSFFEGIKKINYMLWLVFGPYYDKKKYTNLFYT